MERVLGRYGDTIYGVMRIVVGFLFMCHGLQKIFGLFGGPHPDMPGGMVWFVGLIELIGGGLIMIGLFAGSAAFLGSGLMAGAYFVVHQAQGPLPIVNDGEPAVLYCWIFLLIAAKGSGALSIDASRAPQPTD